MSNLGMGLGFAFPFPIKQLSYSSGALINWTKGFAVGDVVGKDVSQCLEEALARNGLNMRVAALANDPVGALALGHYHDKDTVASVIIGTDTNACYIERTDAIIKCQGLFKNYGDMVVNMEWGNFWSAYLPRTTYDIAFKDESTNRNDKSFSKLISEMYLGEIVRRVLYRAANEQNIFGDSTDRLSVPFTLRTSLMVAMHKDDSVDLREVGKILQESFEISGTRLKARMLVMRVCDIVIRRAARLVAAGIVAVLRKIGREGFGSSSIGSSTQGRSKRRVIAFESGLYIHYPIFRKYLHEAISEISGEEVAQNIFLRISEDGSGIGTALLAAAVHSSRRR